eukprot:GHVP01067465.1.p2 GENE.GHVP01067465.1~~GHVP01067465.1.p2  ORF type:complete len:117 (+),score=28.04 GHVP01067465.1:1472-1822(+)
MANIEEILEINQENPFKGETDGRLKKVSECVNVEKIHVPIDVVYYIPKNIKGFMKTFQSEGRSLEVFKEFKKVLLQENKYLEAEDCSISTEELVETNKKIEAIKTKVEEAKFENTM